MSADFPIEINPQHVDAFLDKIARDRDLELQKISQQLDTEVGKIRQQAHSEARQLAQRLVSETRERERRERDRYLYKVHSELTRQRWGVLNQVRERVSGEVRALFERAWADPVRQYDWCRFWIESARVMATPDDLRIYCGAGATEATVERLRALADDYPGNCEWHIDAARSAGLLVEWPDHRLDGTLQRQCETVIEAVLVRVAQMLDEDESSEVAPDE